MVSTKPPTTEERGLTCIGYNDLNGMPGFKLALQEVDGRWLLYTGLLWHRGWAIIDVTDPTAPTLVQTVPGPAGTWTIQVQVADGLMLTALERPVEGWGIANGEPFDHGVLIWDVANDPTQPELLARFTAGGTGTHRNFYAGGRYAFLAANADGYTGNFPLILDLENPKRPKETSRWWWPGQRSQDTKEVGGAFFLHGPAYVAGDYAFLSYGAVGMVILDVSNPTYPQFVSRLSFGGLGNFLGCHSAVPLPERDLVIVNSEGIAENGAEPLNYVFIVDVVDIAKPRIISSFPMPRPEPHLPYATYYQKGGVFGPHNQHHYQQQAALAPSHSRVYLTYFNAGLRVYDISEPLQPEEVGYYVPGDPTVRRGPLPKMLTTQFEDVLIDRRGNIYCTDKNHGLFVLRDTHHAPGRDA